MRPGTIMNEAPAHRDQALARLVPLTGGADDLDITPAAPIPGHVQRRARRLGDRRLRRRELGPLLPGATVPLADHHRRWLVRVGAGTEPADRRQPSPVPMRKPGHLMTAI